MNSAPKLSRPFWPAPVSLAGDRGHSAHRTTRQWSACNRKSPWPQPPEAPIKKADQVCLFYWCLKTLTDYFCSAAFFSSSSFAFAAAFSSSVITASSAVFVASAAFSVTVPAALLAPFIDPPHPVLPAPEVEPPQPLPPTAAPGVTATPAPDNRLAMPTPANNFLMSLVSITFLLRVGLENEA